MIILCFFLVLRLWWKSKNFCFVQKGVSKGRKSSIDAGKIRELKQISDRLKVNKTQDDVQKTIVEGLGVLSDLFINIEDMIKRNSYISASGGLFSDRTYNLLKNIEKKMK